MHEDRDGKSQRLMKPEFQPATHLQAIFKTH